MGQLVEVDLSKYDFKIHEKIAFRADEGLSRELVEDLSKRKKEPSWMKKIRLQAFDAFLEKPVPSWGPDLSKVDFDEISYYVKPDIKKTEKMEELPEDVQKMLDKLGIPEAEKKFLGGSAAQLESEMVYHHLKKHLEKKGIIFTDMNSAVAKYPDIVKKYFGTVVPYTDNKFAALNTAFWSGGSFIYVPRGVEVDIPLHTYFRINEKKVGQFERSLIVVDEGASARYIEGCSAPFYSKASLHAAVVEVIAKKNSKARYTTIQNWSKNVYNLVTKRAVAEENTRVEWFDGNLGGKIIQKYPTIILKGENATAEVFAMNYAGKGQVYDAGAKAIHLAPNTKSKIVSKSISKDGGRASYRGLVDIGKDAAKSRSYVQCTSYILDEDSRADAYPVVKNKRNDAFISHEAKVGRISREKLFYLMSRGLSEKEAIEMIVLGFVEPFIRALPFEYAIELNRLISIQLEGG